jgi:cytochrome b6-f complex iron-sulfur subunit
MSPEDRAAAVAAAQERAAAIQAQRAAAAPAAAAATATAVEELPAWRVGPGGVTTSIATARPEPRAQEAATTSSLQRVVMKRREMLRGGFWAGLGVLAVGGLATLLDLMNPRDIRGFGSVVTVPSSQVPKPGADPYHFIEGKLWLVNLKPGEGVPPQFYSVAPPSAKGGLLALYQKCVHLGCTVPWRPDFEFGGVTGWFRCPCHGSTYAKGGVRVFGPAPRSLDTFLITKVDQNGVSVDTGKIQLGTVADPQRVVDAGPYKG